MNTIRIRVPISINGGTGKFSFIDYYHCKDKGYNETFRFGNSSINVRYLNIGKYVVTVNCSKGWYGDKDVIIDKSVYNETGEYNLYDNMEEIGESIYDSDGNYYYYDYYDDNDAIVGEKESNEKELTLPQFKLVVLLVPSYDVKEGEYLSVDGEEFALMYNGGYLLSRPDSCGRGMICDIDESSSVTGYSDNCHVWHIDEYISGGVLVLNYRGKKFEICLL